VMSLCRIDDKPVRTHEPVTEPDALRPPVPPGGTDRDHRPDPGARRPQHRAVRADARKHFSRTDRGVSIMRKPFAITLDVGSSRANPHRRLAHRTTPLRAQPAALQQRFLGDEALRRGWQVPVDAAPTG
jgi:hypothetical protein